MHVYTVTNQVEHNIHYTLIYHNNSIPIPIRGPGWLNELGRWI